MNRHLRTFTNSIASTVEEQAIFRVAKGKHMEIARNSDGRLEIRGADSVRLSVGRPAIQLANRRRGGVRYDQWSVSRRGCATGERWAAAFRGRLPW